MNCVNIKIFYGITWLIIIISVDSRSCCHEMNFKRKNELTLLTKRKNNLHSEGMKHKTWSIGPHFHCIAINVFC